MTFEQWKLERGLTLGSEVDALIRDAFDTSRAAALEPEPGCGDCQANVYEGGDIIPWRPVCRYHAAERLRELDQEHDR